jgi:hypothetical protein
MSFRSSGVAGCLASTVGQRDGEGVRGMMPRDLSAPFVNVSDFHRDTGGLYTCGTVVERVSRQRYFVNFHVMEFRAAHHLRFGQATGVSNNVR